MQAARLPSIVATALLHGLSPLAVQSMVTVRPRTHAIKLVPEQVSPVHPPGAWHAASGATPGPPSATGTQLDGPLIALQSTVSFAPLAHPAATPVEVHVIALEEGQAPESPPGLQPGTTPVETQAAPPSIAQS